VSVSGLRGVKGGRDVPDPSEQTVDGRQHRDDDEHVAEDETGDAESEPCTVGERVEQVGTVVFAIALGEGFGGRRSARNWLLYLGHHRLGQRDRGGDGHDGRGQEITRWDTEGDVLGWSAVRRWI
jgi:hypothetical protein